MTAKAIFPDVQGNIYLLCPFCNANTLKSEKLFPVHKVVRIDCSCGKSYEIIIEHRIAFRKKTSLSCVYWKKDSFDAPKHGTISDLTLDGCLLLVSDEHDLLQDEPIQVLFQLDNPERSRIKREAVIRRINKNYIGCQFVNKPALDAVLGFYVQDFKVPK
ncbi:MAG: PilZ domain-containing protein [bacterium]|nr:PilZ domain-containing protein [bacterium]